MIGWFVNSKCDTIRVNFENGLSMHHLHPEISGSGYFSQFHTTEDRTVAAVVVVVVRLL